MDKKYLKYLQQFTGAGDKIVEINLRYYKRDFLILLSTISRIENISANKKKNIPLELAQNLVDIFKKPIIDEYRKYKKIEHKHKRNILKVATQKKHNFNTEKCSLSAFLDIHISQIIDKFDDVKELANRNEEMIVYVFNLLTNYLDSFSQKNCITLYSYTVIVGMISVSFGLLDNESKYDTLLSKNKTNSKSYAQYLHNSTKHYCEKENKRQQNPITKHQYIRK